MLCAWNRLMNWDLYLSMKRVYFDLSSTSIAASAYERAVVFAVVKMNKSYFTVAVLLAIAILAVRCDDTPAEQCPGQEFDNLHERIQVLPCGKSRCKLRKGTNTTVIFKFKPKNVVKTLTNDVHALIAGIPLPFVGVAGVSACTQVKDADTGEPAPCPLAPNKEYVYTNSFPILNLYPQVPLRVHWALNDGTEDVVCFEVPAVITAASKKN